VHYVDSDFKYIESTSEAASSGDEDNAEKLEAILGAVYTSSPVKESLLDPAERQSLLLFDKNFAVEEDLESGMPLFLFLHSPLYMYSVICLLPFTHSLFSLIVLYSLYSYMHFHYTFIQKMTVACSQICVLEVNVVQTARTLTPAQKMKNHCLKEDHFIDVDRAMGVKQLVAMEELLMAEDQVVVGRQLVPKEQVMAEEPVVAEEQVVAKE